MASSFEFQFKRCVFVCEAGASFLLGQKVSSETWRRKKKPRVQSLLQQIDRQARTVNLIPHMRCVPSSQSNVHQNRFLRHHRSRHGRCDNGLSVAGRRRFAPASCPLDGDRNMAKTIRITDWFMWRVFFFFPFLFVGLAHAHAHAHAHVCRSLLTGASLLGAGSRGRRCAAAGAPRDAFLVRQGRLHTADGWRVDWQWRPHLRSNPCDRHLSLSNNDRSNQSDSGVDFNAPNQRRVTRILEAEGRKIIEVPTLRLKKNSEEDTTHHLLRTDVH